MEKLKKELKNKIPIEDMEELDIGFGLKALRIMVVRPDKEGQGTDDLENTIVELEGVAAVEVEKVTLI
ncbi:MAG: elongation factor 1-beta [archaeon]|nr:MAG: elongation factor 1-beta [archaeon]